MRISIFIVLLALASCNGVKEKKQETPASLPSAIALLDAQILDSPENKKLYLERAQAYAAEGTYEMALSDIERALRIDAKYADAYHLRGDIHYKNRAVDLALQDFMDCLQSDPKHLDCLLKKAEIDLLLRNYSSALELINTALKENEYLPQAYYMKGRLFAETGDSSKASSSYQTAIELSPDFYEAYIEVALLYAAVQNDLALEYYNSALAISPNSVEALYDKAIYLQESSMGRPERLEAAMACYDQIEKLDPNNAAAFFNKGFIHLVYYEQFDSAALEFSKAIERYPMYFQAFYNRGLCQENMGDHQAAERDYRKSLSIKPDYDAAALALDALLKK